MFTPGRQKRCLWHDRDSIQGRSSSSSDPLGADRTARMVCAERIITARTSTLLDRAIGSGSVRMYIVCLICAEQNPVFLSTTNLSLSNLDPARGSGSVRPGVNTILY